MQDLVNLVVRRTGLSHERATVAVRITLDFIRKKLPAPLALQIDTAIKGSDPSVDPRIYLERLFGEQ